MVFYKLKNFSLSPGIEPRIFILRVPLLYHPSTVAQFNIGIRCIYERCVPRLWRQVLVYTLLSNPSVFWKISGIEKFIMDKRNWGVKTFSRKLFCLRVPKNFVNEPFNVSENLGNRKILCMRRGYH